ncbi:MAG: hypothetical protein HY760_06655 [Nitrospirae bacterium]|nr:hypothetical protein [Nitrospirota bacterium]
MLRRVILLFGFLTILAGAGVAVWNGEPSPGDALSAADRIPPELDEELRALWRGMVGHLVAGNTEGALDYFSPEMRFYHRRKMEDLKGRLPPPFSRRQEIEPGYLEGSRALYRLPEKGPDGEVTFRIWFKKDPDGRWRIESF